jgi:hypothetical protein
MSTNKLGMVVNICDPCYTGGLARRIDCSLRLALGKTWDPTWKITNIKRTGGMAYGTALSSKTCATKRKGKEKGWLKVMAIYFSRSLQTILWLWLGESLSVGKELIVLTLNDFWDCKVKYFRVLSGATLDFHLWGANVESHNVPITCFYAIEVLQINSWFRQGRW